MLSILSVAVVNVVVLVVICLDSLLLSLFFSYLRSKMNGGRTQSLHGDDLCDDDV